MVKKIDGIPGIQPDAAPDRQPSKGLLLKLGLKLNLLITQLKHIEKTLTRAEKAKLKAEQAILQFEEAAFQSLSEQEHKSLVKVMQSAIQSAQASLDATTRAIHHTRVGDSSGNSGLPPWLNPNVPPPGPGGSAGSDPSNWPGDIYTKLLAMLKYIEENPHNPAAFKVLQQYLQNICSAGYNSSVLAKVFSIINGVSGGGENLEQFLIQFLIGEYYYKNGENMAATLAYIETLLGTLKGLHVPGFQDEINELERYKNGYLQQWIAKQKADGGNLDDWNKISANVFSNYFLGSGSLQNAIDTLKKVSLNDLLNKYKNNPMIAILLWFFQMQDTDSEASLSGYAALLKYIQEEIANLTKLENEMRDGKFTPKTAKAFYELLLQIKKDVDSNPALSGIAPTIDAMVKAIGGLSTDGKPQDSLANLFKRGDFKDLAGALNTISNDLTGKTGQDFLNNIKQMNLQFTDQSTATNVLVQQITSFIQTILNAMNKTVISQEGAMGMVTAFVKNEKTV